MWKMWPRSDVKRTRSLCSPASFSVDIMCRFHMSTPRSDHQTVVSRRRIPKTEEEILTLEESKHKDVKVKSGIVHIGLI